MFFKYFFTCCFKCFLATPMMMSSSGSAQTANASITGYQGHTFIAPEIFNVVITALKS